VEVLEGLAGPGSKWKAGLTGGCSAAATGTRTPTSRWYDQGNTLACRLSGCGEKLVGGGNGGCGKARCLALAGAKRRLL
jgi:hypothetical protein